MLLKILSPGGLALWGKGCWHLPEGDRPGKWMPIIFGELEACEKGYHLLEPEWLAHWASLTSPHIKVFEAEVSRVGEIGRVDQVDKAVVRRARLVRQLRWDGYVVRRIYERICECINEERESWSTMGAGVCLFVHACNRARYRHINISDIIVEELEREEE